MTFQVTFSVDGIPHGKGRPRFARRGSFVSTYTDEKTKSYETLIQDAAKQAMGSTDPLETPVALYLYIRLPIPKAYSKKRTLACLDGLERPCKKPDFDNVAKSVGDACNGIVYHDDSQIVDAHIRKAYSETPGIDLMIKEIE
jgi:Holliday junction resolvase RusA-like endonuclease